MDIDIQLYDGETKIVAWSRNEAHGLLYRGTPSQVTYQGTTIAWSGYNGDQTPTGRGNEWVSIHGKVPSNLTMKVYGYNAGLAQVRYAWGVPEHELFNAPSP